MVLSVPIDVAWDEMDWITVVRLVTAGHGVKDTLVAFRVRKGE